MSAKKTNSKTIITSYRIGIEDKKLIVKKYGSLSNFLNKCIAKAVTKIKTSEVKK